MGQWYRAALTLGCCLLAAASLRGAADDLKADEKVLESASVSADGANLLAFFRKRTLSPGQRERIERLVADLGAPEYATREKASAALLEMEALPRLRLTQACSHEDAEVRKRARNLLNKIGPVSSEANLLGPAARVLVSKRPAGVVAVLLDFLPGAEDPEAAQEVAACLASLAMDASGKPDPVLLAALTDPVPLRRQAAGCALARVPGVRASVRKLLRDPDVGVRRRVAIRLVEAGDREAIPELVALLATTRGADFNAIEETLLLLAGERAPERSSDATPMALTAYQGRWQQWWKDNADKIDLARVDFSGGYRGYTLLSTVNAARTTTGVVAELDATGKPRWKIENLNYPVYASMVRRDRVLICEYYGNRVTERDLRGTVLWTKHVGNQVLAAVRLPTGNTFIATRQQLLEVDREGKEVKVINRPFDILAAHRHKDGSFSLLTTAGSMVRLDAEGKQTNSFLIGPLTGAIGFRAHFLPSGGVVVPDYARSKIREYDASGKMIWEADAFRPNCVVKLPNGNVLYASRIRGAIVEIDREGKEITRREVEGRPLFLDRH
ncbi:MAG: hypothetical protein U0840_08000 [Gemmataceae bacterium]